MHGSHRVATENTLFAMPETGIGLFPDVGGSYFLPRCPGAVGRYLALTGARLKAADAVYAGVAQFYVPAARLAELQEALIAAPFGDAAHDMVAAVIRRFVSFAGEPSLARHRTLIDRVFVLPSVEAIVAALQAEGGGFAAETLAALQTKSPTSLKLAHREVGEGATRNFDDCMRMEWRMASRVIRGHDFYEGTRAVVIDKDQKPQWRPASLSAVSAADVEAYFAPLPEGDLRYDWE